MSDKIINFPGVNYKNDEAGDIDPDEMLKAIAEESVLDTAVVLGWTRENNLFVATSGESGPEIIFLMEIAKSVIVNRCLQIE
jgi:hypothetical protein